MKKCMFVGYNLIIKLASTHSLLVVIILVFTLMAPTTRRRVWSIAIRLVSLRVLSPFSHDVIPQNAFTGFEEKVFSTHSNNASLLT